MLNIINLKIKHIYQYGILIGISIFILNILAYYITNFNSYSYFYIINSEIIIILVLLFATLLSYRQKTIKTISYGRYLGISLLIGLVSSAISFGCFFIYLSIDDSMLNEVFFQLIDIVRMEKLTDSQTDQLMKVGTKFLHPLGFSFLFKGLSPFFIIFIASFFMSILSFFTRKTK